MQDLSLDKWTKIAGEFVSWLRELELASSVGQMQTEEELDAARERALGLLSGSVSLGSTNPSSMDTRIDADTTVRKYVDDASSDKIQDSRFKKLY